MKKKTVSAIIAVLLLLAGLIALWQFTDVFGKKEPVPEMTEEPAQAFTEAPAETPTDAPAEAEPTEAPAASALTLAEDAALATVNGQTITYAQARAALYNLYDNGYVENETDYDTAIEYLIRNAVLEKKIKELGLDQFTAEEEEAFQADAKQQWEEAIQSYVSYFLSEDTEEARAQAREDGEAYLTSMGYSVEALADELRQDASYDLLEKKMLEGKDLTVTADEIRQLFEAYAAQEKEQYEGNVPLYEMYKTYYGYDTWFTPEGFRGIIHILLSVDEELLTAYQNAQAAYEDSVTEAAPDGDAGLLAARDAALAAVLDSKKTEIDDIYARLAQGESFESLIAAYGEDPGMQNEETLREGYAVHPESIVWDAAFTAGAFSEKMQRPGDTSDPVIGSHGIHILHYLKDIPGGYVELSDEISASIEEYLVSQKSNEVFNEALSQWMSESEITYDNDAIAAARAIAALTDQE